MGWWEDRSRLAGTVAIITGGAGGLGEAASLDLAANGVSVALVDRDAEAVAAIEVKLAESTGGVLARVGDAREPEMLASLFEAVDERWGRLDTLVNVVGGTFRKAFEETSPRAWDALIRANLGHVLHACALAIPRMKAGGRGGSIINVTTIEAHRAAPGFAVYSAAKAGVTHFARTLAVELAADGIRVNNVAPDIAPTPGMTKLSADGESWFGDPLATRVAIPMGRVGTPSDISNAIVFLASGLSSYITGMTLHPDGGTFASSGWLNWPGEGYRNSVPVPLLDALRDLT